MKVKEEEERETEKLALWVYIHGKPSATNQQLISWSNWLDQRSEVMCNNT